MFSLSLLRCVDFAIVHDTWRSGMCTECHCKGSNGQIPLEYLFTSLFSQPTMRCNIAPRLPSLNTHDVSEQKLLSKDDFKAPTLRSHLPANQQWLLHKTTTTTMAQVYHVPSNPDKDIAYFCLSKLSDLCIGSRHRKYACNV